MATLIATASEKHSWERVSKPQSNDHVASHVKYSEPFMGGLWLEVQILRWTLEQLVLRMISLTLKSEEEGHGPIRDTVLKKWPFHQLLATYILKLPLVEYILFVIENKCILNSMAVFKPPWL